jgi:hypothetical protein
MSDIEDIETQDTNENVEDTVEEQPELETEETEDQVQEETNDPEKEKESILTKLTNKLFGKKSEKSNDTDDSGSKGKEADISENFTQVARKVGYTDEQIIELAEQYSNKELDELVQYLVDNDEEEEDKEEKGEEAEDTEEEDDEEKKSIVDKLNVKDKTLKSYLEQIEKAIETKYQEKFGKIEESLKTAEKDKSIKEVQKYQTTADSFFDNVSKDFPVFGSTDKLARFPKGTPNAGQIIPMGEAFDARNSVYQTAMKFHLMGTDWNEALDEALVWYKGKNMEKDVRSRVLKELKTKETRLSPKRSERSVSSKAITPDEEKGNLISDLARRAGIN